MNYNKKNNTHDTSFILVRIRDIKKINVGEEYHLRKMITRTENVFFDEVHDIKVLILENDIIKDEITEKEFIFSEFDVFKFTKV